MGGVARGRWALQDVWHSFDAGATWRPSTSTAPWSARSGHACVALRDGHVLLLGGVGRRGLSGDVWRTEDALGAEWKEISSCGKWPARYGHSLVVLSLAGKEVLIMLAGVGMSPNYSNNPNLSQETSRNIYVPTLIGVVLDVF